MPRNMMGDSEANLHLDPPNWGTYFKEQMTVTKRNWLSLLTTSQQNILLGR